MTGYGKENFVSAGSWVLAYARIFSVILTVLVLTAMGFKFMFESVEEKAVDKKKFVNVAIGIIFLSLFINLVLEIFKFVNTMEAHLY